MPPPGALEQKRTAPQSSPKPLSKKIKRDFGEDEVEAKADEEDGGFVPLYIPKPGQSGDGKTKLNEKYGKCYVRCQT